MPPGTPCMPTRIHGPGRALRCALAFLVLGLVSWGGAASADQVQRITEEDRFLALVEDRTLRRSFVRLEVTPDGFIRGRGFGRAVRGPWEWQDGYFCRDLYWGETSLGANCQAVHLDGTRLRFTSDRGTGDSAAFRLR